MQSKIKRNLEQIVTGIAFLLFMIITCYKLTASSLWYDEAIEYWYSKIMVGELPMRGIADGTVNMYQRIVLTFQPPLYNVIIYFWLKVCDTELWFRFFGVVMGLVGMTGIYKSIKKISNVWIASVAVVCSSTIYQLYYYWQECAEYCLMLGILCWTIYFWICLLEKVTYKNIIVFTLLATAAVYSQYGAIFPVAAMAITAYVYSLFRKQKKDIIAISSVYIGAVVLAGVPLYIFFLQKQMLNQHSNTSFFPELEFQGGVLQDIITNMKVTFSWNFFSYIYSQRAISIVFYILLLVGVIVLVCSKNSIIKVIIWANVLCWMCYYMVVKIGVYSYGNFGRRYNLFFTPMWIVLIFSICIEMFSILSVISYKYKKDISIVKWVFLGICIVVIGCYSFYNWAGKIRNHAYKSDIRGPVELWYEQKAYEKETIVYYAADPGFAYYVQHNEQYNVQMEENIHYMEWMRGLSVEEYSVYIEEIYNGEWPEEVYIIASNYVDDLDTLAESFIMRGYIEESMYDLNGGKLIYLYCSDAK